MGLFDRLFGNAKQPKAEQQWFQLLNGYTPVFHSWGGEIYESELVRSAIDARARHISKLDVKVQGAAKPKLQTRLKEGPNEWQTWGQFLYRLSTILDCRNTAFIVPVLGEYGEATGVYPINPIEWALVDYKDEPYIRFRFENRETAAMELRRVGIMTKFQYKDDLFGTGNMALAPTMELIQLQNQGISEGVKNGASFRFMATMSNFASDTDLAKESARFSRNNFSTGGGVLLWPNTYKDIKQIESKPFVVEPKQMELMQKNVYDYFGINEDILQNKAIGDAWAAFYEGAIEPFAIQFSDVMTRMLFTPRERTEGSLVAATSNRLQYASNADKLSVSEIMADRGLMTRNEIREIWNLPPLPDELGETLPVRGEYYNVGEKSTENNADDESVNEANKNDTEGV